MSDVVIVGSGAAGAAIAGLVARAGASVTLLDGGPVDPRRPGSNIRNAHPGESELPRQADLLRAARAPLVDGDGAYPGLENVKVFYAIGGMLTQWVGNCPEPDPDHERPSCIPKEDWSALIDRARTALLVRTDLAMGGVRQERLIARLRSAADLDGARPIQAMPVAATSGRAGILYHGADVLLAGGSDGIPPTLRIIPDTVAVRIDRRGSRVLSVDAIEVGRRTRHRYEAPTIVVAAGTVGTPRLLMSSGIESPALGRYLMDHPSVQSTVRLHPEILEGAPANDPMFMVWIPFAPGRPYHGMAHRSYPWASPGRRSAPEDGFGEAELRTLTGMEPDASNALELDLDRPDAFGLPAVRGHMRLS